MQRAPIGQGGAFVVAVGGELLGDIEKGFAGEFRYARVSPMLNNWLKAWSGSPFFIDWITNAMAAKALC